ncbi:hypothetical protein [Microbacterium invictum]|uniref:Uncharacterized protein n=1 Tax=Microbacterium invictum TaxID=515415 RepID=A0ABZ0VAK9_9MICO|nr:hypothetical protein [Microbacterium invictum]WQB69605.1 hypothetical protein T9R20_12990 [Microbacterium invictum]
MKSGTALVLACVGAIGAAAGIALAAAVAVPPSLANLNATVHPAPTEVAVAEEAVRVTAPAGWVVRRPPFDDDELTLTSPDGRLEIAVTEVGGGFDTAFADLARANDAQDSAPVTETLSSGARARHTEIADAAGGIVLAAVGDERGPVSAGIVARVTDGAVADYRYAIAEVLDTVRVTS